MLSVPSYTTNSTPPPLSAPSLIPNPYSPQVILIPIPHSNSPSKSTPTLKTTTPAQRPSYMILPFLHDTNVPFGDSSQGGPASKQGKKADMSAFLEKWDDKWKEMKKE
jgi:hypothetical protein